MIDPKNINDLVQKIMQALPDGVKNIPNDAEENVRVAIQGVLNKLDIVTREEFEAQKKVLLKTREKLEALEEKLK